MRRGCSRLLGCCAAAGRLAFFCSTGLASTCLFAFTGVTAWAQDSHYWTEQFGNRARLLGGAVVAGGTDIAVVYYNPGALALMEKPEILLAGNVFEVKTLGADPVLPDAEKVSSTSMNLSPSLFAGQLRNEVAGGQFAYSFLTRSRSDFRLQGQSHIAAESLEIPNVSFASNNTLIEQSLGDHWFGGTWARGIGERVGVGISTFFAIRSQTTRFQDTFTVLAEDNRAGLSSNVQDFDFWNVRLLWKIGLATNWERWQFGLTVTTPSLSLFGSGTSTFNRTDVVQGRGSCRRPAHARSRRPAKRVV